MITVWDEKKKKFIKKAIKDITYNDLLVVWNFDEGKLDFAKPIWIKKPNIAGPMCKLTFSNGEVLDILGGHKIFCCETNSFVDAVSRNFKCGNTTYTEDGKIVTLIKKQKIENQAMTYSLVTEKHFNCFANGILTSTYHNNLYAIDNMKFVKNDKKLRKFEEYDVPKEYYDNFRLAELTNIPVKEINDNINSFYADYKLVIKK